MAEEEGRNSQELPDISRSLEVERLDPMLFRSKSLIRPYRARGVFGGHVISQAVVAATDCVDRAFSLHARIANTTL
jgi:acyl-CoA thioesterase